MEILEIKKQLNHLPLEEKKNFLKGLIKDQKKIKLFNDFVFKLSFLSKEKRTKC